MSGHTQGPWDFDEETGAVISADDVYIGTVSMLTDLPCVDKEDEDTITAECRANGYVIAAAPELLFVLGELIRLKDIKDGPGKTDEYLRLQPQAWSLARFAINRARGQS